MVEHLYFIKAKILLNLKPLFYIQKKRKKFCQLKYGIPLILRCILVSEVLKCEKKKKKSLTENELVVGAGEELGSLG